MSDLAMQPTVGATVSPLDAPPITARLAEEVENSSEWGTWMSVGTTLSAVAVGCLWMASLSS